MADTGFKFPGTMVGNRAISGGLEPWINPDNAKADDASVTNLLLSDGDATLGLGASNFDFSLIPFGSTIDGIEAQVGDYKYFSGDVAVDVLRLILADDSDGSENKNSELAAFTGSNQTDQVGGASDLWGETIARADVQDVDWGFFLGVSASALSDPEVDFMQMKVYYTEPTTAVTAWKFPSTVNTEIDGGDVDWTNPDNVSADDASNATVTLNDQISYRLIAQNFGFSIPAGATIVGLEVRAETYSETGSGAATSFDVVAIRNSDNTNGGNKIGAQTFASPTGTPQTDEIGGEFDLWGVAAPSIADVEDVDFGYSFKFREFLSAASACVIDSMQMRIHYVEAEGDGPPPKYTRRHLSWYFG